MNRRPRVIQCVFPPDMDAAVALSNEFASAHSDDVIKTANGKMAFFDSYLKGKALRETLVISRRRTRHLDDPLEWFADVIHHAQFIEFYMLVSSTFIQRKLPGANPLWSHVHVYGGAGRIYDIADMYFTRLAGHYTSFVWPHADVVAVEDMKNMETTYARGMRPYRSFLALVLVDHQTFPRTLARLELATYEGIDSDVHVGQRLLKETKKNKYLCYYDGPAENYARALARLQKEPSVELVLCGKVDHQFELEYEPQLSVTQKWAYGSTWRQPRAHETILDVCLGLASLWLPPYVLLEIIDWLPRMHIHRALWKIRLIQRVIDCSRRALNTRNAIARNTRSRTKTIKN